jgi:hypothetical protein
MILLDELKEKMTDQNARFVRINEVGKHAKKG